MFTVYFSNETLIACDDCELSSGDVYFDHFQVRVTRGKLKEESHYYPFGLPMGDMGSAAAGFMPNRRKYQGNEYIKDAGLNWMDFHARQYDPQIGRFLSVDPLAAAGGQDRFSPYAGMGNNPVTMTDPGGMKFGDQMYNLTLPRLSPPPFAASSLKMLGIGEGYIDLSGSYHWEGSSESANQAFWDKIMAVAQSVSGNVTITFSSDFATNFGPGGGGSPDGGGGDDTKTVDKGDNGNPEKEGKFGTYAVWDRAGGYDKKLSKEEADLWSLWGGGKSIYVDNSRIDWDGLSIPEGKKPRDVFVIETHEAFLKLPYETAATYGGTSFNIINANTVEVLDQEYHYKYRENNSIRNIIRNFMTWWGAPSYIPQGQPYMIHYYNEKLKLNRRL